MLTDADKSHDSMLRSIVCRLQEERLAGGKRLVGDALLNRWKDEATHLGSYNRVAAIRVMADSDFWRWRTVIEHTLDDTELSEETVRISIKIVEKYGGLSHIFPFEKVLEKKTHSSLDYAKNMVDLSLSIGSFQASKVASILSGGIAEDDAEWIDAMVRRNLESPKPANQAYALMTATRLISCDSRSFCELRDTLLSSYNPGEESTQIEYCAFLRSAYPSRRLKVEESLIALLTNAVSNRVVWNVMETVCVIEGLSIQAIEKILEIASNHDGDDIQRSQSILLIRAYSIKPDLSLRIIVDALNGLSSRDFLGNWWDHTFVEMGKINTKPIFRSLSDCLQNPNAYLIANCVEFLESIFSEDMMALLDATADWRSSENPYPAIRLKVLGDLISKKLKLDNDPVKERCIKEIFEEAETLGLDKKSIIAGERNESYQALMLMKEMLDPLPSVDYNQLFINLDRYPHIRDFIGVDWFEDKRDRCVNRNLLLQMFHRKPPTDEEIQRIARSLEQERDDMIRMGLSWELRNLVSIRQMFAYWEDVFSNLDKSATKISRIRGDLRRNDRPGDYLCELEVIGHISRRHKAIPRHTVKGLRGKVDLYVELSEQNVILEVYNPQPPREMLYALGTHGLDTRRNKKKVRSKLETNLKIEPQQMGEPYVLVVFSTGFDFSEDEIDDIFLGSLALKMQIDKTTGETIASWSDRSGDSLAAETPLARYLSGILLCRRDFLSREKPTLLASYFPNPETRTPLSETSTKELLEAFSPA